MKIFNLNISPTVVSTIGLVIVLAIAFSIFFKPLNQGGGDLPRAANTQKQADVESGASSDTSRPSSANLHKQVK